MRPPAAITGPGRAGPIATVEHGLWLSLLGLAMGLFSLAMLLLPQQLAQAPAHQGLLVLHLEADGSLRLWNRAVSPQQLPGLLREAGRLNDRVRVRLVPSPTTPWGLVQRFLPLLEVSALPFEIQLPAPDPAS